MVLSSRQSHSLEYFLLRAFLMSIDNPEIIPANRVLYPDFSTHCCIKRGKESLGEWKEQLLELYRLCIYSNSILSQVCDPEPQLHNL